MVSVVSRRGQLSIVRSARGIRAARCGWLRCASALSEIVDGARPIRPAIVRLVTPFACTIAVSSRSASERYLPDGGVQLNRLHASSVTEPP